METISEQKQVKANKVHQCNFCQEKIRQGETYLTSTHKQDGELYVWKIHKRCSEIATTLKMYEGCDEGLTADYFQEYIHSNYSDLMIEKFDNVAKYSDVILQLRSVNFHNKLDYVIHHYAKLKSALIAILILISFAAQSQAVIGFGATTKGLNMNAGYIVNNIVLSGSYDLPLSRLCGFVSAPIKPLGI